MSLECLRNLLPPKEATQEDVAELLSEKNRPTEEPTVPAKQPTGLRGLLSKPRALFFRKPNRKI